MKSVILNRLASIQCRCDHDNRRHEDHCHGCHRSQANLILFHLLVDKYHYRSAICLRMLLKIHPLHKPVENVASRIVKCHATPLHDLLHRYNVQPKKIETIQAMQFDMRWTLGVHTKMFLSHLFSFVADHMLEGKYMWHGVCSLLSPPEFISLSSALRCHIVVLEALVALWGWVFEVKFLSGWWVHWVWFAVALFYPTLGFSLISHLCVFLLSAVPHL